MAAEMHDPDHEELPTDQLSNRRSEGNTNHREQYRTPDEDMATEFGRLLQLFEKAVPKQSDKVLFARLMNEANARGLSWIEGLEYVTEQRRSSLARTRT